MALLSFEKVHFSVETRPILQDLTFSLEAGERLGVLGPNGAGKTTLLQLMAGVLRPNQGRIFFQDRDLNLWSRRHLAQHISVLPQETQVDFPFSAEEIVLMGRAPYLGPLQWESSEDLRIAYEAMDKTDCLDFAQRDVRSLSGGERERVFLARALTQQPELLLLDEPTTHLDLKHQGQIRQLLQTLHQERKLTMVLVLHDLNLAAQLCDKILLLSPQHRFPLGTPEQILTPALLREVFEVEIECMRHPKTGQLQFFPVPTEHLSPQEPQT